MLIIRRILNLWRNLIHKAEVERELDEELQAYQALLMDSRQLGKEQTRPLSLEMARPEQIKESVREVRAGYQLESFLRDLRHGVRLFAKNPGFTAVAIMTLGLGVGANSAIFSVVNAVLLRPLPFDQPDRLVRVCATAQYGDFPLIQVTSWKDFTDWQQQNHVFAGISVFTGDNDSLSAPDGIEQIDTADVSPGFFELLRVNPILGRTFASDDKPGHRLGPEYPITGGDGVSLLGEGFWRQRFGADPNIIGRSLVVDGYPSTVIGVIPDRFDSLVGRAAMYFPFAPNPQESRDQRHLFVIGRLQPGVSIKQGAAEMDGIAARLRDLYPDDNYKIGATVLPLQDLIVGHIRWMLLVLFGAVGMVLLIACGNVASLLLARGAARRQEVAIRSALGASRLRLLCQFLTESFVLSAFGGCLALVLAFVVVRVLVKVAPDNIPRLAEVDLDRNVLAFTILLSILTALIFGLAPALRTSGNAFVQALKEAGRGPRAGHAGARRLLVVSELAVSLLLLTACGLLLKSFYNLRSVNPGFDTQNLVTAKVVLPEPEDRAPDSRRLFYDRLYKETGSLPAATSVALTNTLPLAGAADWEGFVPEGRPLARDSYVGGWYRRVSPDYFATMRIPVIQGREFDDFDSGNAQRVVILSQSMARRLWPNESPLGKHLFSGENHRPVAHLDVTLLVVGVVGDVKWDGLDNPDDTAFYVPCAQDPLPFLVIVARSGTGTSRLAASIKGFVGKIDKDLPVGHIRTMDQILENTLVLRRFNLVLVSAFAGLALLLAAVGAYGVSSYSVAERTQEIGVRMALGATRFNIVALVVGQGFRLAIVGTAIGVAGAFVLTRLIATMLFEVSPTDPATFALVAAFLFAVSLLASYVPARRATRVDPMRALRSE
jgi:putative ABC transport system permease protein